MLKIMISMVLVISLTIVGKDFDFDALLSCNVHCVDVSKMCNPWSELLLYQDELTKEQNYPSQHDILHEKQVYVYPNIHPTHQAILNVIADLDIRSVCEIGAGCGEVSKYIFFCNNFLDMTCVEHSKNHFRQLKEHFEHKTGVILPNIRVRATLINDSLPYLASLNENSYDLVFTSAVMMHIPFIVAARSAVEIVRVSKKYILHVENKNDGSSWYDMAVIVPKSMSGAVNSLGIDYPRLYERLGVKTIKYEEYSYPDCPGKYVVYLGEKIEHGN